MTRPTHQRIVLPAKLDPPSVARFAGELRKAFATGQPLVLSGAGNGIFCTGLDVSGTTVTLDTARGFAQVLGELWQAPVPTLAEIDGTAIGGGMGLAAACDRIIATPTSVFGLPELLWGFVPAMIWPVITTRLNAARARWWVLTGRTRSAAEALEDGFIDELIPATELTTTVLRRVRECSRADANAIPLLRALADPGIVAAISAGAETTVHRLANTDVRKRIHAYENGEVPW
jgi:enoyl-CoA hydratase/carnithine racemase